MAAATRLERLVKLHRRHTAGKRDVAREAPPELPDESALELAERLACPGTGPEGGCCRRNCGSACGAALDRLTVADRELLVLRHAEQLSTKETAAVLGISEAGRESPGTCGRWNGSASALGGNPLEESS